MTDGARRLQPSAVKLAAFALAVVAHVTAHDSIVSFLYARSRLCVTMERFFAVEGCGKRISRHLAGRQANQ